MTRMIRKTSPCPLPSASWSKEVRRRKTTTPRPTSHFTKTTSIGSAPHSVVRRSWEMSLMVAPGATVRVTNKDTATHTLTATGGQFNTDDINQNQTKTFTAPMKPGTYHYICNIHQYMMGSIVVK